MSANLENSVVATELEKINFHPDPREGQCQRMFKLLHSCAHFTCQQGNAQNPPARLQQYVKQELPGVQPEFRKGSGMRDQIADILWIIESWGNLENICFTDCVKVFDCVDHNKMCKILKEMGIPASLPPEKPVCRSRRNS